MTKKVEMKHLDKNYYKQKDPPSAPFRKHYFGFIYEWTDSTNSKTYIGSHYGTNNDGYVGSGKLFKRAYNKRPDKFTRRILEYIYDDDKEKILETEQKYLDKINWDYTYNLVSTAHGGSEKGRVFSKSHKNAMSKTAKGKLKSKLHKKNMSKSRKGQLAWNKGIPCADETKQKISKTLKENPSMGMSGKKHSQETKRKISESHKGNKQSEATKQKRSKKLKRKPWSATRRAAQKVR